MPDRRSTQSLKGSVWGEQLLPNGSFYRGSSSGFASESGRSASVESTYTGNCSLLSDDQQDFDEISILSIPSMEPVSVAFSQESSADSVPLTSSPLGSRPLLSDSSQVGAISITPAQLFDYVSRERDTMEARLRPKIEAELTPLIEAKLRTEIEAKYSSQRPAGLRSWFESNRIVRVLSGDLISIVLYAVTTISSFYINWANAKGRSHSYLTQVFFSVLTGFASCATIAVVTAGARNEPPSPDSVVDLTFGEAVQYAGANGTSLPYKVVKCTLFPDFE